MLHHAAGRRPQALLPAHLVGLLQVRGKGGDELLRRHVLDALRPVISVSHLCWRRCCSLQRVAQRKRPSMAWGPGKAADRACQLSVSLGKPSPCANGALAGLIGAAGMKTVLIAGMGTSPGLLCRWSRAPQLWRWVPCLQPLLLGCSAVLQTTALLHCRSSGEPAATRCMWRRRRRPSGEQRWRTVLCLARAGLACLMQCP